MKIQKVYIIICCKLQVDKKYILFWNSGFAFHQFFHYFSLLLNITWWMYLLVVTLFPSWHEDKHKGHLLCMVVMLYKSIYVPSIYQVFAVDRIWSWVGVAKRRCLLFLTLTSLEETLWHVLFLQREVHISRIFWALSLTGFICCFICLLWQGILLLVDLGMLCHSVLPEAPSNKKNNNLNPN